MSRFKKSLFNSGITLSVLYVLICVYFYNIQDDILFHPTPLPEGHTYSYDFDFEERWFEVEDEARIHAIHARTDDALKGLVIFFHGNAGNNQTSPKKYTIFLEEGYDVLYPDYRGFGLSTGVIKDEEDLVGDMKHIYVEMTKEYAEENIFLVGYSMGTGIAAQVAAANDPKGLMLWTPYYSMVDMKNNSYPFLPSFLMKFPLRTDKAIPKIDEPITIFYAGADEILPVERSIRLTELLKEEDRYFVLPEQRHGWIHNNPELYNRIPEILEGR